MHLTKTEVQVVEALAAGQNSRVISERRFRTQDTINKHIKNARHKLGAKTIGELIYMAVKQGLIKGVFLGLMVSQSGPCFKGDDGRPNDKRRMRVARSFSVRAGRVREDVV